MPSRDNKVPVEEIPMPPIEEDDDFADVQPRTASDKKQESMAAEPTPKVLPTAALTFHTDEAEELPLRHSFDWDGKSYKSLTLRRLTLGQVQDFSAKARAEDGIEMVELYAAIANIDVAVARGLKDEDGEALADRCQDFLPRAFRGETESA